MKTLFEYLINNHISGNANYKVGNRVTLDNVPCTVVLANTDETCFISDLYFIDGDGKIKFTKNEDINEDNQQRFRHLHIPSYPDELLKCEWYAPHESLFENEELRKNVDKYVFDDKLEVTQCMFATEYGNVFIWDMNKNELSSARTRVAGNRLAKIVKL